LYVHVVRDFRRLIGLQEVRMKGIHRSADAVRGCTYYVAALGFAVAAMAPAIGADSLTGPLVLKAQGSFFVGGVTKHTDATSGTPGGFLFPNPDDIQVNQMYVQFQVPEGDAQHVPIVLLHGCCLTGKTWETTPDGRMGWGEYFVRNNRAVYIPDQSSRARSGFDATTINEVRLGTQPPSALPNIFIFGRNGAWQLFRFGPAYPAVFSDEQFPVEAIDEFGKQVIPDLNSTLPTPNPTYANLAALAVKLNGAILVGHSESGFFPEEAALTNPAGVAGLISIEGGCTTTLSAQQITTLAKIPTLVIFGDHLGDVPSVSAFWLGIFQGCQQFVAQINAAGGDATMLHLPDVGLLGNSHMLMQDKNNLHVAGLILQWINKHVERGDE
jgi:pimeloyl-ACP methyl ester carboxylesterase